MKWINIFRNKLAVKLSVLVLCISLFLLLAFVFTNQYAAKKVRQNTLELNRKLLAQVEKPVGGFFDNLYNVAASFSYSPHYQPVSHSRYNEQSSEHGGSFHCVFQHVAAGG